MSTAGKPTKTSDELLKENPFFYGWRYVRRNDENGRSKLVMEPLTREDALHPRLEDHVTQNDPHQEDVVYLTNVLRARMAGQPAVHVFSDMLFDWGIPGFGNHGPDIAVVFGIRQQREWESFNVSEEGVRPSLIIEVTSPSTRDGDLNDKVREYARVRIPFYVIVDYLPRRRQRELRLLGYELGQRSYHRLRLNRRGRLWLEPVQLWLGHQAGHVVLYDKQGRRLEGYTEVRQRAETAEERAETAEQRAETAEQQTAAAAQRAETAEERVRQLEAELRRLRGEEE